jgi:hypothetical protein
MIFLAGVRLLKGLTRIFTDDTDQEQAIATAGPSTALLTKCVSNFAQNDRWVGAAWEGKNGAEARAEADSSAALRNDKQKSTAKTRQKGNCKDETIEVAHR